MDDDVRVQGGTIKRDLSHVGIATFSDQKWSVRSEGPQVTSPLPETCRHYHLLCFEYFPIYGDDRKRQVSLRKGLQRDLSKEQPTPAKIIAMRGMRRSDASAG